MVNGLIFNFVSHTFSSENSCFLLRFFLLLLSYFTYFGHRLVCIVISKFIPSLLQAEFIMTIEILILFYHFVTRVCSHKPNVYLFSIYSSLSVQGVGIFLIFLKIILVSIPWIFFNNLKYLKLHQNL